MKPLIVALGCTGSNPLLDDLAGTVIRWNMRYAAALEKMLLERAGHSETRTDHHNQEFP